MVPTGDSSQGISVFHCDRFPSRGRSGCFFLRCRNIHYRPAKITAVAFALALELSWKDLKSLLESAGYAMTHTSKFDIVIEYFVRRGDYDIDAINEVLYELNPELPLIGC